MMKLDILELVTEEEYLSTGFNDEEYSRLLQIGINEKSLKSKQLMESKINNYYFSYQMKKQNFFHNQDGILESFARQLYSKYRKYDKIQATIIASGCAFKVSDQNVVDELLKIMTYDELSKYSKQLSETKKLRPLEESDFVWLQRICQFIGKKFHIEDPTFIAHKIFQLLAFQKELFLNHNIYEDFNLDMVFLLSQYQEIDSERYFLLKMGGQAKKDQDKRNKVNTDITNRSCTLYHDNHNLTQMENSIIAANYGLNSFIDTLISISISFENAEEYSKIITRIKQGKLPKKLIDKLAISLLKFCHFINKKTGIRDYSLILNRINQICCFEKDLYLEKEKQQQKTPN